MTKPCSAVWSGHWRRCDLASEPGGEAPDAFARRIGEELVVWRDTAKAAGIEPE
jgi:hypothetical protein